ncbi:hypothetical protein F5148DRAFT_1349545 [Russula earlei]|uniref:Uncharacterized protein n=1 Tax=Russula earlei TaxID=71964 RepID=A0ACC0UD58_9AGAM|nr:hypothetical protein F5148DRAFT_1349545 [Russula earlei]
MPSQIPLIVSTILVVYGLACIFAIAGSIMKAVSVTTRDTISQYETPTNHLPPVPTVSGVSAFSFTHPIAATSFNIIIHCAVFAHEYGSSWMATPPPYPSSPQPPGCRHRLAFLCHTSQLLAAPVGAQPRQSRQSPFLPPVVLDEPVSDALWPILTTAHSPADAVGEAMESLLARRWTTSFHVPSSS